MKQIATRAGVSREAVSKIINNKGEWIGRATRDKVLKIARELNYRPNYFAKSLKTGKTNCIGLLGSLSIVDVSAYCFAKVTEGIEKTLSDTKSKYSLMMFGANFQAAPEKTRELIERRMVDGIILILLGRDLERFHQDWLPWFKQLGLPFVVVHSTSRELPYHNVGVDSRYAGYAAAEHFIKLGYPTLGFYLQEPQNPQVMEALDGFKKAVQDRRLPWHDSMIIESPYLQSAPMDFFTDAYTMIKKSRSLPRALFFPDESGAYGALKACQEYRIRVPEDLAFIGYDDEQFRYMESELSTIHHPFMEKGANAVTMLEGILEGRTDRKAVQQSILKPYLVIRKTCGGGKGLRN